MSKRIVYVQYTNPAGYPPLEHSSLILARRGWDVLFLGVESVGTKDFVFPEHARLQRRMLKAASPGWRQKVHYLWFCVWALWSIARWWPHWVYASEMMSAPVALACRRLGIRTVYHEHDSPGEESMRGTVGRYLAAARRRLSQQADLSVLPNEHRLEVFRDRLQPRRTMLVWNCPRREEVRANRGGGETVRLLYHGSINAARLPLTLIDALLLLPERVRLRVGGYETIGSRGYVERFRQEAIRRGLGPHRIEVMPPVPARQELMDLCAEGDIGIGFLPRQSNDINMTAMFGASNKVFDYMACGLALLVSDQPDWAGPLVASGTAESCNPDDPASIAAAVGRLLQDPNELRRRGERGRELIRERWNYESQFQPLLETLESAV